MELPNKEQLQAWDDAHLWHPFTPHSVYREEDPLLVVGGEGHYLIDSDGKRYLDGVGSLWCNLFGHRRPEIDAAVRAQLDRIAHATLLGHASAPAVQLAKRLADLAPAGLTRVFFSDDGSTAVEVALKMALQFWQQADGGRNCQRRSFVTLSLAYHGDTVGSVSLGGIDLFHERYRPLLFQTVRAPSPYCYRCPLQLERATCGLACVDELERVVLAEGDRVAAVVLESGMQGAAGMVVQPESFLRRARAVADRVGALLVLDEVATGFGRSGRMFACETEGVVPDLLCLGKGLTGGYLPMAATLTTERIFEAFTGPPAEGRTFFHGHTYTGNALAECGGTSDAGHFQARSRPGPATRQDRTTRRGVGPAPATCRRWETCGSSVSPRAWSWWRIGNTKAPFPAAERRGMRVCRAARTRGVFLRPLGDVIVLMPPLSISDREITQLVDAIEFGIREICP